VLAVICCARRGSIQKPEDPLIGGRSAMLEQDDESLAYTSADSRVVLPGRLKYATFDV
jgi:hypothetical protein